MKLQRRDSYFIAGLRGWEYEETYTLGWTPVLGLETTAVFSSRKIKL